MPFPESSARELRLYLRREYPHGVILIRLVAGEGALTSGIDQASGTSVTLASVVGSALRAVAIKAIGLIINERKPQSPIPPKFSNSKTAHRLL